MTMGGSNYSVSSSQSFYFAQVIEAHTAKQLQLGQSTAKNFTVSFWGREKERERVSLERRITLLERRESREKSLAES